MTASTSAPFRILTVCTGNICRSPAAELLLQAALGPSVEVRSAGTHALVGRGVEPTMAQKVEQHGVATSEFSARQITEGLIRDAGLVLAMSREHRSYVVELVPAAVRRSFTLLEFDAVVQSLGVEDDDPSLSAAEHLREIVPAATAARSSVSRREATWDVPDPYRRDIQAFDESFALIRDAVERIADRVNGNR